MLLRTSLALQTFRTNIPSLLAIVREINGRYTFNIFNVNNIKKWTRSDKKLKIFEVSIKTFCRKWDGETLRKWLFAFKNAKTNAKTNTILTT